MQQRRTGKPAPYGQACIECFKAKCKCIQREDPSKCARCYRLGQKCTPSDKIRRRRRLGGQRAAATSTVAGLEKKLDGLAAILQAGKRACPTDDRSAGQTAQMLSLPPVAAAPRAQLEPDQTSRIQPRPRNGMEAFCTLQKPPEQTPSTTSIILDEYMAAPTPMSRMPHFPSPLLPPHPQQHSHCILFQDPREAASLVKQTSVAIFRDKMLPWCPFTHLPQYATATDLVDSLAADRPLFLRAIVTVNTASLRLRAARTKEMGAVLLQQIVADARPTLDLVLAVLTLVAWKHETSFSRYGPCRLLALLGPAVHGICLDVSETAGRFSGDGCSQMGVQEVDGGGDGDAEELLEKCRAVLGHYVLTSSISPYFKQISPIPWTRHLEHCLQLIERSAATSPLDAEFAVQVRFQRLAQEVQELGGRRDLLSPPVALYCSTLLEKLHGLEKLIQPGMKQRDHLRAQSRYLELCIHHASVQAFQQQQQHLLSLSSSLSSSSSSSSSSPPPSSPSSTYHSSSIPPDPDHVVALLWATATAARACFDIWLSIPPTTWIRVPVQYKTPVAEAVKHLVDFSITTSSASSLFMHNSSSNSSNSNNKNKNKNNKKDNGPPVCPVSSFLRRSTLVPTGTTEEKAPLVWDFEEASHKLGLLGVMDGLIELARQARHLAQEMDEAAGAMYGHFEQKLASHRDLFVGRRGGGGEAGLLLEEGDGRGCGGGAGGGIADWTNGLGHAAGIFDYGSYWNGHGLLAQSAFGLFGTEKWREVSFEDVVL